MKPNLRRVLIPTIGQAIGCLVASLVLILLIYHGEIIQRVQNGAGHVMLGQVQYGSTLAAVTNSGVLRTVIIVVFWSGVGLVAYTIVWSLINVTIEARNEVVLQTEYTNKSALVQRLRAPLAQLALATLLFVALLASARWAFPYWLSLADQGIRAVGTFDMAGSIVAAVLGTAATIYGLILLGQLVFWIG